MSFEMLEMFFECGAISLGFFGEVAGFVWVLALGCVFFTADIVLDIVWGSSTVGHYRKLPACMRVIPM